MNADVSMVKMPIDRLEELDPEAWTSRLLMGDEPEDAIEFIQTYLTIPSEQGKVVKFNPYPQQKLMIQHETGRDVTVKGRQTRASSIKIAMRVRRMCFHHFGARALIAAQDDQTTALFRTQILHHIKDLKNAGWDIQLDKDNADEIVIAGRENRFEFVSGQNTTMGRGFARQEVHLSELAHWKESTADKLIGGILPSVPPPPFGHVDFESTPNGQAGAFYKYAMAAKPFESDGEFTIHFYGWWNEPRYRVSSDPFSGCDIILSEPLLKELTRDFTATDEETKLMALNELTLNQILWRRLKKKRQDMTDAPFIQEFPEDVLKCWIGTSGRYFDTPDGEDHLEEYRVEEREPLKYLEKLTYRGDEISFFGPNLAIWEFPKIGDAYVVAFDAAGGGQDKDSDFTSIGVWNATKEKRVARLTLKCSPKLAAAMVCAIGAFYGSALVSGERSHHGAVVFDEINDLHYPNLFYFVDPDKPTPKDKTPEPGIYPTPFYRQKLLEEFKRGVTLHEFVSYDAKLNQQMALFTWQKVNDRMKAQAERKVGSHDDVVMEAAQGWFACKYARMRLAVAKRRTEREELIVGPGGIVTRQDPRTEPHYWLR